LALNPYWRYQATASANPDVDALCAAGDCTSQPLSFDLPVRGTWAALACQAYHTPAQGGAFGGSMFGHANWGVATYTGTLSWDGTSPDDDDHAVDLIPPAVPGTSLLSGVTRTYPEAIHSEFDDKGTLARFHSAWWSGFQRLDDGARRARLNGRQAVITGLYGLDCEHNCLAELHPVYILAVLVSRSGPVDNWAFFVRRSGDEGYCSTGRSHDWPRQIVSLTLPGAGWPTLESSSVAWDHRGASSAYVPGLSAGRDSVTLSFNFGGAPYGDVFDGVVTVRWGNRPGGH
jgi:hypothetical protein